MPSVLLAVSKGETVVDRDRGGRDEWAPYGLKGAATDVVMVYCKARDVRGSSTVKEIV